MKRRQVQLRSQEIAPWAKAGEVPTEFALFYFGANESTKGTAYLDKDSAAACMATWVDYGNRLAGDYEHGAAKEDNVDAVPASCWFDLEVRSDGLYAVHVEWTERGKAHLLAREYRYYSPFFIMELRDDEKWYVVEIINVALTNQPATKRQRPLVASRWSRTQRRFSMFTQDQIDQLKALLQEKASLDETAAAALVLEMMPICCAAEAPAPEPPAADDTMADTPAENPPAPMQYSNDPVVKALQEQMEAQAKELAALKKGQAEQKKNAKEQLFSDFDKKGKLRYADKKKAKELLDKHGEGAFRAAYESVPEVEQAPPAAPKGGKSTATGTLSNDAPSKSVAGAGGLTYRTVNDGLAEAAETYRAEQEKLGKKISMRDALSHVGRQLAQQ